MYEWRTMARMLLCAGWSDFANLHLFEGTFFFDAARITLCGVYERAISHVVNIPGEIS